MDNKRLDEYLKEAFGKKAPFSISVYQNTIEQMLKIRSRKDRLEMFEAFFLYAFYGIKEPFEEICKKYAYVSIYNMVKRQRIGWENGTKSEQNEQKKSFSYQKNEKTESLNTSLSDEKVSFTPHPIYNNKDINKENKEKEMLTFEEWSHRTGSDNCLEYANYIEGLKKKAAGLLG